MRSEEIFGVNAGKIWHVLNVNKKPLSINDIMKLEKLKRDDVLAGLGWLGREGKIEIIKEKDATLFKLI
jgi:DNA-binding transcriptional regulator GbsR (MarR family)